ncbi:MAG TPA: ROK family protein [Candidatus Dormibacteraeota bacterium]|nr:ROK family protein [Candidatus Dormibacteraeota bacterium]
MDGALTTRHVGLDLGGTSIKWVVVESTPQGMRTVATGKAATDAERGPNGVVEQLAELGRAAVAKAGAVTSVGVGVPGLHDPATGRTRFLPNIPGDWAGVPVVDTVKAAVGLPTVLINDARAFALAELRVGAGRGARSVLGITLGTGVGGGLVIDGEVYFGHDGTAGEIGHQTILPDGPLCGCGNYGCLEALCRASAIAAACGCEGVEQAAARARSGDERARAGLAQVGRYLGIGIGNAVVLFTPDVVVIGGGTAQAGDLLLGPIHAELKKRIHVTNIDEVRVVFTELGPWAGAMGAALHGADSVRI